MFRVLENAVFRGFDFMVEATTQAFLTLFVPSHGQQKLGASFFQIH
ncbi:hypothetical protein [Luteolibacter sp. Populi]